MLPFALKVVWFALTIIGTIFSYLSLAAVSRLVGNRWVFMGYSVGMFIFQFMLCLGMIWRMDPYSMPRTFCLAQTIGMSMGLYIVGGFCLAFCMATSLHIQKPKQWGEISKAFAWRPVYYLPVVVFPLVALALRIALIVKYDAVQPYDGLHCDAADPLWVHLAGYAIPSLLLLIPASCLAVRSTGHVIQTFKHVKRARRDDNELPRQIRRERVSGHHSYKQSVPVVVDGDQDPAPPETTKRFSFHLPFFRNVPPISQTLTTPPPSLNPSPGPYQDGRSSVASSSFPTFAPLDKPVYPNHRPNESEDAADGSRTWIDEESCAPTTLQGHETPEALELDVKSPDEDDGTYRLSYRENTNCTPSRISHLAYVPLLAPQIQRLLICQVGFPIATLISTSCIIADGLTHRQGPRPINTQDIVQLTIAWTGAIAFGSLKSVRSEICTLLMFWKK
ncbi:hypothetical protein B0H14DRAFT_2955147 [Mycena olivaceomarginata]|nr:hypothetical protein B0H14DRAFT_2955147 [Mycena olivaceomarginata]